MVFLKKKKQQRTSKLKLDLIINHIYSKRCRSTKQIKEVGPVGVEAQEPKLQRLLEIRLNAKTVRRDTMENDKHTRRDSVWPKKKKKTRRDSKRTDAWRVSHDEASWSCYKWEELWMFNPRLSFIKTLKFPTFALKKEKKTMATYSEPYVCKFFSHYLFSTVR